MRIAMSIGKQPLSATAWIEIVQWFTGRGFDVDFIYSSGALVATKSDPVPDGPGVAACVKCGGVDHHVKLIMKGEYTTAPNGKHYSNVDSPYKSDCEFLLVHCRGCSYEWAPPADGTYRNRKEAE